MRTLTTLALLLFSSLRSNLLLAQNTPNTEETAAAGLNGPNPFLILVILVSIIWVSWWFYRHGRDFLFQTKK